MAEMNYLNTVINFHDPKKGVPDVNNTMHDDVKSGDRYISNDTYNGWMKDYIYEYNQVTSTWEPYKPQKNDAVWIEDLNKVCVHDGNSWAVEQKITNNVINVNNIDNKNNIDNDNVIMAIAKKIYEDDENVDDGNDNDEDDDADNNSDGAPELESDDDLKEEPVHKNEMPELIPINNIPIKNIQKNINNKNDKFMECDICGASMSVKNGIINTPDFQCYHCFFWINYAPECRPTCDGVFGITIAEYVLTYHGKHEISKCQRVGSCFLCDYINKKIIKDIKNPELIYSPQEYNEATKPPQQSNFTGTFVIDI